MNWLLRYRIRHYIQNSIWIFPVVGIVAALLTVTAVSRAERAMGLRLDLSPETGRAVLGTVAGAMFTLITVVSSAVLVAVQLASAQLTPRIITLIYRNTIRKLALSMFVFTFTFALGALVRIEKSVPLLTSYLAVYCFIFSLAIFLYLVDVIGKTLRPSSALRAIALGGRSVIRSIYPRPLDEDHSLPPEPIKLMQERPRLVVTNEVDGVVVAFDLKGLVALAEQTHGLIELVPSVGDFIAAGDPLFRVFSGDQQLSENKLRDSVALDQERSLDQDPTFAFRIIVDIASKALSPAINDPTTAVLAIDQLHHLLRDVGSRYLAEGQERDASGTVRLVYRTPNWEDFVHLAMTEVRLYGADSIQVMRRLRAMLENLITLLPQRRASELQNELGRLKRSTERKFADVNDRMLAETSDLQGMGGGKSVSN